jgi:hypothetical protein
VSSARILFHLAAKPSRVLLSRRFSINGMNLFTPSTAALQFFTYGVQVLSAAQ